VTVRFQEAEFAVTEATQGFNIIATFSKLPETFFLARSTEELGRSEPAGLLRWIRNAMTFWVS